MKKILIMILVVVLPLVGCNSQALNNSIDATEVSSDTLAGSDGLSGVDYSPFFSEEVHELYITIDQEDFKEILNDPTAEEYYSADINLDGESITNIGFRTKGNSTLKQVAISESDRYSFKFKVNEYEDQKFHGLDEFVVNNMFSDASYLREYLSYDALSAVGADVPLTSFVNVYINDELYGFYLLVESVDDSFLNRNFGHNDGNLYRADQGTTLKVDDGNYIENVDQKNGKDDSKSDLYELMDILNAMPDGEKGDIESVLDVESALRYIAGNTLLENYDSLNGQHAQNYYLYNDGGIFTVIPWDYNMSFGTFGTAGQSTVDIYEPVSGTTMDQVPFIQNLLEVDEYRTMYDSILVDYINHFDDFESHIEELADMIRPYVENDPSKFATVENFELNVVYQEDGPVENETVGGGSMPFDMNGEAGRGPGMNGDHTENQGDRPEGQGKPDDQTGTPPNEDGAGVPPVDGQAGTPPAMGEAMNMDRMRPGNMDQMGGSGVSIINILLERISQIERQLGIDS